MNRCSLIKKYFFYFIILNTLRDKNNETRIYIQRYSRLCKFFV